MNTTTNLKLAAVLAAALFLFACGQEEAVNKTNRNQGPKTPPVRPATIDEMASGKNVYETNCTICHKSDGTGGKVSIEGENLSVENLTSAGMKRLADEKLIGYIMNGIEDEGMPAFKGKLSEGEIRDVVKYIRTVLQKTQSPSK